MAKGVASGYAAISCTVTTEAVFSLFKDDPNDPMSYFRDISTFGGCTGGPGGGAGEHADHRGRGAAGQHRWRWATAAWNNLQALMDKHKVIGDVRGKGLFLRGRTGGGPRDQGADGREEGRRRGRRLHGAGRDHRHDQPLDAGAEQHALPVARR
jgi:hypothetical protein